MFGPKTNITVIYLVILLLCLAAPFLAHMRADLRKRRPLKDTGFLGLIALVVGVYLAPIHISLTAPVLLSVLVAGVFAQAGVRAFLGAFLGLLVFSSTVWWAPEQSLTLWRSAVFLGLGVLFALLVWRRGDGKGVPLWPVMLGVLALGLASNAFTGVLSAPVGFRWFWHNWGVYMAPPQILLSGGVPFSDFALQYGFGPMLLMALGCQFDCWGSGYFVTALVNLSYLGCVVFSAILLTRNAHAGVAVCAVGAVTASVLLWSTYPPDLGGVLAAPSAAGMRFLPIAALVTFILHVEARQSVSLWPGYVIWFAAVIWSPEAAIFTTVVWWPYLALRHVQESAVAGKVQVIAAVSTWVGLCLLAIGGAIAGLALAFWMYFGDVPSLDGYLVYIRNPPGVMSANMKGPVWILLTAILIGGIAIRRAEGRASRPIAVCLLATVAVATYYLGRSHDNNVLNLFPFIALLLISVLPIDLPQGVVSFAKALLVGMVVWIATFGLDNWAIAARSGNLAQVGFSKLAQHLTNLSAASWPMMDAANDASATKMPPASDLGAALQELAKTDDGTPVVFNQWMILPRTEQVKTWTGVTNAASYLLLPKAVTEGFIRRGAKTFNRAGWVVIERGQEGAWLDLFQTAYTIGETRVYGGYDAYRMVPR